MSSPLSPFSHLTSARDTACGLSCWCSGRRRFSFTLAGLGALAASPLALAEGVRIAPDGRFDRLVTGLVPPEQVEAAAAQQYQQMLKEAKAKGQLLPESHPQVTRLRAIAKRLLPFVEQPNLQSTPRARQWRWEVNVLQSPQINAFCMPGGKIAFYFGILQKLQLTDDEVAMVMGHEIGHALREHARERMGKSAATGMGANLLSSILGLGNLGQQAMGMGAQLLTLRFSREHETEADMIGLDLAARAGFDPAAGVSLWQKMSGAKEGGGSAGGGGAVATASDKAGEWLSTHPSGTNRIREIEAHLPDVAPLYRRASRPLERFGPPPKTSGG